MENMPRRRPALINFIIRSIIIVVLVMFLILFGSKKVLKLWGVKDIKTDSYSAVFLDNNQVYFGLIKKSNLSTVTLTDVYYFGSRETSDRRDAEDLSLVKLGTELHGPKDGMKIFFEHILFIETLRDDSRVVEAILEYKEKG